MTAVWPLLNYKKTTFKDSLVTKKVLSKLKMMMKLREKITYVSARCSRKTTSEYYLSKLYLIKELTSSIAYFPVPTTRFILTPVPF